MSTKMKSFNKVLEMMSDVKNSIQNRYNLISASYDQYSWRLGEIRQYLSPNEEYDLERAIANVKLAIVMIAKASEQYEEAFKNLIGSFRKVEELMDKFETEIVAEELPSFELSDTQKLAIASSNRKDKEKLERDAIENNKLEFVRFFVRKTKGKSWQERFGRYRTADILRLITEYAKEHNLSHTDGSYEHHFWMSYQTFCHKYDFLIKEEKIDF